MWTYHQQTGQLWSAAQLIATGYSGAEPNGKNNPATENIPNVGPIPRGFYTIQAPRTSAQTGPYAMPLLPLPDTNTYGRADFEMHGDSIEHPGSASHGCIIMPPAIRTQVWTSGDHQLQVI